MSTNTIIEIIRAHEDPCAILERLAPRFAPFELEVALKYATDLYGSQSPILSSVMIANLRAHHNTLWWARSPPQRRHIYDKIELAQVWGVAHTKQVVSTALRIRAEPYYLCCLPQLDQGRISLRFRHESHDTQGENIYQTAFGLGLEEHGARLAWMEDDQTRGLKELYIPLKDWERMVPTIEQVLIGDQLISFDEGAQRWFGGPLIERACGKLGQPKELLEHWLVPYGDDDDIPF